MMGIIILLCGAAGLAVSGLLGTAGVMIYRKAVVAGSGDLWLPFWSIAAVVALIVIGIGVMYLSGERNTPPKASDFYNFMKALFLFGAAPGVGMLAGVLALLFK